jgi:chromosome segregation protein
MRLSFVEIEGFRGFREKVRFDLSSGFTVLTGRNGSGKSTVLDAIEFALSGTIDKFQGVTSAKGGGLDHHFWWVGPGKPSEYAVTVGFTDDDRQPFDVTRSRAGGCNTASEEIMRRLCRAGSIGSPSLATLIQTTLIRDEKIAALSLDLPEQARFAAVRAAIGGLVGPDYSQRTASILEAARSAKTKQDQRIRDGQAELGRLLGEVTEAKSIAERSGDIADALRVADAVLPAATSEQSTAHRLAALRSLIAERKVGLREIESARALSESLLAETDYFVSADAANATRALLAEQTRLTQETELAAAHLDTARRLEQAEQEQDLFAAHLAALVEHGGAIGLQDGHCPLCDAVRTNADFDRALAATRARLVDRGSRLVEARASVATALTASTAVDNTIAAIQKQLADANARRQAYEGNLARVQEVYSRRGFKAAADDPKLAQTLLFAEQEALVRLERALAILESSGAVERVASLESRIAALRKQNEMEAAKLGAVERGIELARQIDAAAKTVANEILTEQFDTVMPLLKELYRRLRPHANWSEIESDFGGKVRGSLNFVVGDGYNPQFLFSSGQRRAAGLSFLLAVHLARPWCEWTSLLLDDPVQHIDDYRALNLVEVLATVRRTGRQVVVAVEDNALGELLCRRLRSVTGDLGRVYELRVSNSGSSAIAQDREIYPMPHLVLRPAKAS